MNKWIFYSCIAHIYNYNRGSIALHNGNNYMILNMILKHSIWIAHENSWIMILISKACRNSNKIE